MTTVRTIVAAAAAALWAIPMQASAGELRFWSWRNEDKAVYAELIKDFNAKNPDVKVTFEGFEPQNYATVLSTALAAEKGPDVMMVRAYGAFEAVAKPGYLLELNDQNVPGLSKFPEAALKAETLRSDGKVYAVPFASQTMLIVYNTEVFAKNGVKVPETWDELVDASKKLKAAGVIPFANGTATAWQNETIVGALLSSMLGKQFEADILSGKADFTDKRFVDALAKLQALAKDNFAPSYEGIDYPSSQQLFSSGAAAMFAGGSFEAAPFLKANPALKLDVFPSPAAKAGDQRLVAQYFDGGYAINAKTPNKADALKFINFLASKEFGDKFANQLSNISPIPGVAFKDPILAKVSELNKNSMSYLFLVHFRYQEPSGSVLEQAAVQKMLAGKQTPAEAGAEITKGIATYFAPFKK
ncbi:extracellular solute-binding protein [Alsobacter sp. SYSU M60028]|uniref:Extracellular solute-binding protein n=1 Tax=Alsobacter ponti TaxID=2962936 RepID=A0ABT1LDF9_9HYPH|nr:extracellular solute-binding protein [Alsobacter ponti]MCP8938268.1 extracellular solute-binding protein [Alsobacter ponti]